MEASGSTEQWVVLAGDPVDGFRVIGPFDNASDAAEWANTRVPPELHGREAPLESLNSTWPD